MPINLAFMPLPNDYPSAPLLYVTELYGKIKAIDASWNVHTYAKELLNFTPDYKIPRTGECGVTGITVEPQTGIYFSRRSTWMKGSLRPRSCGRKAMMDSR